MSERNDFLEWVGTEVAAAEVALHNGDASPRRALWSQRAPVTLFGARRSAVGRAEVDELFSTLEKSFSGCMSYVYDIIAADVIGDMAYTVGYDRIEAVVGGELRTYTLRATQIYRREEGDWKLVHRHGDSPPDEA
jgi:ketosteroid isomerase-like protein